MDSKIDVDAKAFMYALMLSSSTFLPMTLNAVIELGVINVIVDLDDPESYLSAKDLALKLGISNPTFPLRLDRLLSLLASYEIISCSMVLHDDGEDKGDGSTCENSTTRCYGAKPVCKYLTIKDGVSLLTLSHERAIVECWYHMKDALINGEVPFHKAHGMAKFDYLSKDSRLGTIFNKTMSTISTAQIMKILASSYTGFEGIKTLVNIGGGNGMTLNKILSKHITIKGINFDLPHVIAEAPPLPRIEHVSGDMFECIPSGDAILLKHILHDWSDDHCIRLLKKCWEVLPKKGKVIVLEGILPATIDTRDATKFRLELDVFMLLNMDGGRERTEKEFKSLARKACFSEAMVVCDVSDDTQIMEFIK